MSEQHFFDLGQIKAAMHTRIDDLVMELFPEAKKELSCWKVGSLEGERGGSMIISTRQGNAGFFQDYANPELKGQPWKLLHLKRGLSIGEAIRWLANYLNVQPIQSFDEPPRSKNPSKLSAEMRPLTPACIAYAEGRGIQKATLQAYGVGSDTRGGFRFPYYDGFGSLGMTKHWGLTLTSEGKKDIWTSADPIMTLFGKDVCNPEKVSQLVITEGEFDAMACWQVGIPAVSIPQGASNDQWISLDYHYLSLFDDIVLLFDNDEPGQKAAKAVHARLGSERTMIVKLPLKDANDMLKAGRGAEIRKIIDTTVREPIAEIVEASSMRDEVRSQMRGDHLTEGDPFFIPDYDLTFRKHEMTLWFGASNHGKSTAVENQIAFLAGMGKMSLVASFEQQPAATFAKILKQWAANQSLVHEQEEFDRAFDYLSKIVILYRSMKKANPDHLVQTFIHAHKRYGIDTFVVDNVMTMDIDRGDNTEQADAADKLRVFVADYPVHLHVVAHPRKPKENNNAVPTLNEIRGASEWGDIPQNVIAVWRDSAKGERLAEMRNASMPEKDIMAYFNSTPCGKLVTRKQRATGDWPMTSFYFHKPTGRMCATQLAPMPLYGREKPWQST